MGTDKKIKSIAFLIASFISLNTLSQIPGNGKSRFEDFYNLKSINKVEVSLFKKDNYTLVKDYNKLIELMQLSKVVVAKFIPRTELTLYDSLKNTTYNVYFSERFNYFKIDNKTFAIGKKKSKKISKIISMSGNFIIPNREISK